MIQKNKLTPPEIARMWGIAVDKVWAWIRSGELRAINAAEQRHGRPRYLVDRDDLAKFEECRRVLPPTPPAAKRRRTFPHPPDYIEFVKES